MYNAPPNSGRDEYISQSCQIETNLDCNYTSAIDKTPNGIQFGAKTFALVLNIQFDATSIWKVQLQTEFGLLCRDWET